ncbi:MAG TPA: hypothetical protein GXX51_04945 [Firmicutes bacterium]|nr:hypothetical protein [Bacillota bacterium]
MRPLFTPLAATLNAWSREAELTADRAGYLCCRGDVEPGLRALLLLALGSRKYLNEINLSDYLWQENGVEGFYGKLNLWFGKGGFGYDHPYLVQRVKRLIEFAYSDVGQALSRKSQILTRAMPAGTLGPAPTKKLMEKPIEKAGARKQTERRARFCRHCGFEIGLSGGQKCPVCGSDVR